MGRQLSEYIHIHGDAKRLRLMLEATRLVYFCESDLVYRVYIYLEPVDPFLLLLLPEHPWMLSFATLSFGSLVRTILSVRLAMVTSSTSKHTRMIPLNDDNRYRLGYGGNDWFVNVFTLCDYYIVIFVTMQ